MNSLGISKPEPKTCWFCEKPRSATAWRHGRAVCASCDGFMQQGVICIGVSVPLDADTLIDKIYRDGNWCVLSRAEYERRFNREAPAQRFAFVTKELWRKAYLPRFGKHGASHNDQNLAPLAPDECEDLEALDDTSTDDAEETPVT